MTAHNGNIPENLMQKLSDYLATRVGLSFGKKNWNDLRRKMTAAMTDFGFNHVEIFIEWLIDATPTQNQIEILASHLTVGETYFFREKKAFEILQQFILPDLIDVRRKTEKRLRIWSAGCSTGEEAYSIAILLVQMIPDFNDWNISIIATDINPSALKKARDGIYSQWSFREAPERFKERYFEKSMDSYYVLKPQIRKMVVFSYLNLSQDAYPSLGNNTNAMDLIFCRNVLMYFAPGQAAQAIERFYRCLVDGGFMKLSPVESSLATDSPFVMTRFQDTTFYQKNIHQTEINAAPEIGTRLLPPPPAIHKHRRTSRQLKRAKTDVVAAPAPAPAEQTPFDQALILCRNGLYQKAEEKLGQLILNGGKNQENMALLTKALANQGKLEEALRWCEEAIKSDKCNSNLYYLRATILQEQNRLEEARVSLKKALYLNRNFAMAHFALANISLRSGRISEARKHLGNSAEILSECKPDDVVPESEGITAGRLSQIISAVRLQEEL